MRSRLAAEWEAMGWEWDLQVGGLILDQVAEVGAVDANALAAALPSSYLTGYGTDRETLAAAIKRAIGGEMLAAEEKESSGITILVHGDNYTLSFGDNAQIDRSPFNIGPGTQLNLDAGAEKEDLLLALRALVASGLAGEWDPKAALAIGHAVEEHGGLTVEDVGGAVVEAGSENVDRSRVQELTEKVAISGFGGFLATALGAGLGDLAHLVG
jgi:hypothetical protein